jgi:adenine-specific DNA methylase
MSMTRPRVLAEDWLPMVELGIESRRERAAASALPPLSFLHVWWARRPLVASAGVVLAGLLPAWTPELTAAFPDAPQLKTETLYRGWLKHLTGIWGDPIKARLAYDLAVAGGVRIPNPYTYRQAFRNHIDAGHTRLLARVLQHTWGEAPLVADVTAGGGSIPFAAARLGLRTYANDLNGVAAAVLRSGVQYPAQYGPELLADLEKWGGQLISRIQTRISAYFPSGSGEQVATYIWAQTVACPRTGKPVPLVPDWTLRSANGREAAVRIVVERDGLPLPEPEFEIAHGKQIDFDPKVGTVKRGDGLSPWDDQVIDEAYIKDQAQTGNMTQTLYAVAIRLADGTRTFRSPGADDLRGFADAANTLMALAPEWRINDVLPTEELAEKGDRGRSSRPRLFGMNGFAEMFTARQLLVHGVFVEEYRVLVPEVQSSMPSERAKAVLTLLGTMQGKAVDYNAKSGGWDQTRQKIAHVFTRHDFSFKWAFAEFEGTALYTWALAQLTDAYRGLANLMALTGNDPTTGERMRREITVSQGNAADIPGLPDGSVAHLCMDPPYYDNVMYAELSDFFYVWEKRTVGRVAPELFPADLADKDNEAVANASRFAQMGNRMRALADADYEAKMTAIFTEARRILRDDGVLTVMFTHKRAEAWDTLGMGLLKAGFTIETSWPVNTEAEHSLHQSGVNSAASTIMLVCRKRDLHEPGVGELYLEDIEGEVRLAARDAVIRFRADGIDGVDLLLSAYGPTLSVVSQHWPVFNSDADEHGRARLLRPEEALAVARAEIVRIQRARLVGHPIEFDPLTDFVVAFWDVIKDGTATFDEGRRLALAVGALDIDELQRAKVLEKKAGTVRLLSPKERLRPRAGDDETPGVRPHAAAFGSLIDAVHTVCLVAEEDGLGSAKALMDRAGLSKDSRFVAAVQALVNAVPRVRMKGSFLLPFADTLDRVVTAYLPEVEMPEDRTQTALTEQGQLFEGAQG